jgi:hypothetical protein
VLFLLVLFLHIATMFLAVGVAYGGVIFFLIALRARNGSALVSMSKTAKTTARLIPPLFGIAGLLGLVAAIVSGANLLAPWLIIAYLLFIVLSVVGGLFTGPSIERIGAAVEAAPDGTLPADLPAMTSRFYMLEVVDFFFLFLIIFDMVVKPFN